MVHKHREILNNRNAIFSLCEPSCEAQFKPDVTSFFVGWFRSLLPRPWTRWTFVNLRPRSKYSFRPTRGNMLQEHVGSKCSGDKIAFRTHWRDMLQGPCKSQSWHTCEKSCRDVFQGVVATHSLVCAGTFSLAQHEISAKFAPATCRTEFNLLNLKSFFQNYFL